MSSASSTASWRHKQSKDDMEHHSSLMQQAEKTLEHQQSLGNTLLQSIDADWLEQHKELLDLFIQDPNNPAVLGQIPQGTAPMDTCQPGSTSQVHLHLQSDDLDSEGAPLQLESEQGMPSIGGVRGSLTPSQGNIVTTGFGDGSPAIDTPKKQASKLPGLRVLQTARSDPVGTPTKSSAPIEIPRSGLVPEISLAARAGSLGATSIQSSQRLSGLRAPRSEPLRTSESEEMDLVEDEEEQPVRKGPGRKKRTAPILVETEDGETKFVSPTEFRKLRRRITNRLSARRMRKKHAEERAMIHDTTKSLEDERNQYRHAFGRIKEQLAEAELRCRQLYEENCALKRAQWRGGLPADQPIAHDQGHQQLGLHLQMGGMSRAAVAESLSRLPQPNLLQPAYMGSFAFNEVESDHDDLPDIRQPPLELEHRPRGLSMPQIPLDGLSHPQANPLQLGPSRHPGEVVLHGRPLMR